MRLPPGRGPEWPARMNGMPRDSTCPFHPPRFAHRTHQAIRSYAANYPEEGEDSLRWAFADQLEQRVLPKLRGLDPMEDRPKRAILLLEELVRELEDPELVHSIHEAREHYSGLFEWQGVPRTVQDPAA